MMGLNEKKKEVCHMPYGLSTHPYQIAFEHGIYIKYSSQRDPPTLDGQKAEFIPAFSRVQNL